MKVSIVTISYNQAKYIEQTIRSVIEQDYPNIEYIVVDPGSTDGSREIIQRYEKSISKIIFEPDNSPADGLNKGFEHATGDVFGFVNSDDKLMPGAVRTVVDAFRANPWADVVYGKGYIVDASNNVLRTVHSDPFNLRRFTYGCVTFVQPSVFFKRDAFFNAGGFNTGNKTSWDGELLADFGLQGRRFALIPEFLSSFRLHDTSISGTGRLDDLYEAYKRRLFKKVLGREMEWYDSFLKLEVRVEKWIHNPVGVLSNIAAFVSKTISRVV